MPYCPKTKFSLNVEHYVVILTSLTSQIVKKRRPGCWFNRQLYLGECGLVVSTQGVAYQTTI